jgi:hypothetical protein
VPVICPVAVLNERPFGNETAFLFESNKANVNAPVPPVAVTGVNDALPFTVKVVDEITVVVVVRPLTVKVN